MLLSRRPIPISSNPLSSTYTLYNSEPSSYPFKQTSSSSGNPLSSPRLSSPVRLHRSRHLFIVLVSPPSLRFWGQWQGGWIAGFSGRTSSEERMRSRNDPRDRNTLDRRRGLEARSKGVPSKSRSNRRDRGASNRNEPLRRVWRRVRRSGGS